MAWYKPSEWEWKGQKYKTEKGQFVTSLDSIVKNCGKGVSVQNVRTALVRFEKLEFLTNESTKIGRLITIVNWESYQLEEKNQQTSQQLANKDLTPKEKGNKENNINNKNIYKDLVEPFSDNTDLTDTIYDFIKMRNKIKSPLTERALKTMLKKLNSLSDNDSDKIAILENSILNNWKGVFELKDKKGGGDNGDNKPNPDTDDPYTEFM